MTARTLTQARLGMLGWILLPIGLGALGYGACVALSGCGTDPALDAQASAYGPLQVACVVRGGTKAETDYCRDSVKEFYCSPDGGLLFEAGACLNVTLSNGNRP